MNRITFMQFLQTYNFRRVNGPKEEDMDTQIVRIYPQIYEDYHRDFWFEFGVHDFSEWDWKKSIAAAALSEDILNSYIDDFSVDTNTGTLHIYLTQVEEREDY